VSKSKENQQKEEKGKVAKMENVRKSKLRNEGIVTSTNYSISINN
jgi:hypothetical protein